MPSSTAKPKLSETDFVCMSEAGCDGTVEIIGKVQQSKPRKIGLCTKCKVVHLEEDGVFEPIFGTVGQFKFRLAGHPLHQSGTVVINRRGRQLKQGQYAGPFGTRP